MEQVEMTLGERLINQPHGQGSIPLLRRLPSASRRLRQIMATRASGPSQANRSAPDVTLGQRPAPAQEAGDRDGTSTTIPRGLTGKQPRVSPAQRLGSGSHLNRAEQAGQQRISETGEWRRASNPDARALGQSQARIPQPSRPHGGAGPRDPRNANDHGLPELPENNSSWRWKNPNEQHWLNGD